MSNMKFKHDLNSHAEAKALYEQGVRDLAHNTRLRRLPSRLSRRPDEADAFEVVHHETAILTFYADGSVMINAAYVSRVTAFRLNHYKPVMIERFSARQRVAYGDYRPRYVVTLANHPGEFDIWQRERYVVHPDMTVVKV